MPHPPLFGFTLRNYMYGAWNIEREIKDRLTNSDAHFEGEGIFSPNNDGLHYKEKGHLLIGNRSHEATQTYDWTFPTDDSGDVFFPDGKAFHKLIVIERSANADHHCAPDNYSVSYRFDSHTEWHQIWRVSGPRKDYTSHSVFTRLHHTAQSLVSGNQR